MEKYRVIRILSDSSTSRVSLASLSKDSRRLVILKEVNCLNSIDKEAILNESKVLSNLSHPNIVKLIEYFIINYSPSYWTVCIITEYCEGGDLSQLVSRKNNNNNNNDLNYQEIIIQLLLAVKYLHDKNIIHRDLKLKNIFIASKPDDRVLRVKIGDFGIARWLESNQMATTLVGTPFYLSPELCSKQPYDKSVDIWSLGCVIYELIKGGQRPFNAGSLEELLGRIQDEPVDYSGINDLRLVEMIKRMLCKNPRDRLTIDGLLYLPIIQEYIQDFVTKISDRTTMITPTLTNTVTTDNFSNNTTELLLNTMQSLMNSKSFHQSKFQVQSPLEMRFHEQLKSAAECLKFIKSSPSNKIISQKPETHPHRYQKEVERVQKRLSQLLILPSRIQQFSEAIKRAEFNGLKELGDENFIKEVLENGLIGDTFVMQNLK